jgi:predicted Zn-dependent peptidase
MRTRRSWLAWCVGLLLAGWTAVATAAVRVPPHERVQLPNGITVLLMPQREVPMTAFAAVLRGGARGDPSGKAGLASLTAALLEKGAGSRDARAFAETVAGVGGDFSSGAGAESIVVSGQFLSRDRSLMLELLSDALLRPRFDAAEFTKLRDRAIEGIKAAKDSDPGDLAPLYGRALLFGAHPFGAPQGGSERSLATLGIDDVRQYYRDHVGADRLTLVVTGDIDVKWFKSALRRTLGAMKPAATRLAPLTAADAPVSRKVLLIDAPESTQAYFWLGGMGVARSFPQRAALDVANTHFGGRFTSMLVTELRMKSGLSYTANSAFNRGSVPGEFAINSFTQTENAIKAIDLALATLERLHREGLDQKQLDSARTYVLGQYPTRLETAVHWAGALADLELYGLDRRYIEDYGPALQALTLADVTAVLARAVPQPAALQIVVIGDAATLRGDLARYGTVVESRLTAPDFIP